jgi:hypothetical protein
MQEKIVSSAQINAPRNTVIDQFKQVTLHGVVIQEQRTKSCPKDDNHFP